MIGQTLRTYSALARSVAVYHGDRGRHRRMDVLYRQFLSAGQLAFDIGSHVGDRVSSFRRVGARVVALEPQPGPARIIRLLHGRDPDVTIIEAAAGASEGELTLRVNSSNPTVSTASEDFIQAANDADGWREQAWDATTTVPMTTLDALIAQHGVPAFIKIDVEGFEDVVLKGLSQPVAALSFEFTTISRAVALRCLETISALGAYRFNVAIGESQELIYPDHVDHATMAEFVASVPHQANSGDIYAVLKPADAAR